MNNITNLKRYIAKARYLGNEDWVTVHTTTRHPDSSYGIQVFVDDNGNGYGQINLTSPLVEIRDIFEISDEEAESWENRNG